MSSWTTLSRGKMSPYMPPHTENNTKHWKEAPLALLPPCLHPCSFSASHLDFDFASSHSYVSHIFKVNITPMLMISVHPFLHLILILLLSLSVTLKIVGFAFFLYKKMSLWLGIVTHSCNPSIWEVVAGDSGVKALYPGYMVSWRLGWAILDSISKKQKHTFLLL